MNNKMLFKPIKQKESLTVTIVKEIEEAIRSKKLPINEKLPSEKDLCLQFNVSKTVMREALKLLCGMGLVNIQKGKGVYVNQISKESVSDHIERYLNMKYDKDSIIDMYIVREVIEPNIVSIAALNRSKEDLEKLEENVKKFSDQKINFNDRSLLDGEFHLLITKATKNLYFPIIMEPIYNVMYEIRKAVYPYVKESGHSAEIWHRKILNSIINKDPEEAKSNIIKHLEISRHHTQKWIEKTKKIDNLK